MAKSIDATIEAIVITDGVTAQMPNALWVEVQRRTLSLESGMQELLAATRELIYASNDPGVGALSAVSNAERLLQNPNT